MSKIAVIKTGGKQYKVKEGDVLKVEKLDKSFFYSDFDRKILKEKWFQERVFDIYLWEIGG